MPATALWNKDDGRRTAVFRADASLAIGTGHIMRCLTLADELRRNAVESVLIVRAGEGDMRDEIERRGYRVISLPECDRRHATDCADGIERWLGVSTDVDAMQTMDALAELGQECDWLVVDHYGIDHRWERRIRPMVGGMLVIDDLANRSHECDMLLDQNLYERMNERYEHTVNPDCIRLLGPQYALIREEFQQARSFMERRSGKVGRLFVFFGGVDVANLTMRTINAVTNLQLPDIEIDVVIGNANPHRAEIEASIGSLRNVTLHVQTREIARLMAQADLSIGAGGTTTWERAYLGLPSISVVVAENQREMTDAVARAGACVNLGWHEQITPEIIAQTVVTLCGSPRRIRKMSSQALAISAPEHQTGTGLVAKAMLQRVRVTV
jgi:UDP-2,4-diacetamido-2,4,6-trideoxy-beta-L-altropyranose hydrolase